ncbi:DUF664 domain-containing protein [Aquimarina sp. MMG016]|uniref:DinB family protein n=1 Tax=Aquimarina sp. MMG016 TaxID=2822690 RepID=UPI001B3A6116|nr:DUF664 domain-containing protein [Aquimarina sp. MMG016]MBQ4819919.1 DUF664 domain-containing protein [Aquimarina sp. MMG016]
MKFNKLSLIIGGFLLSIYTLTAQTKEITREWVSFEQEVAVKTKKKVQFKVRAYLKTEGSNDNSVAALWAGVENKNDENGFGASVQDSILIKPKWSPYEIEGHFDEYAEKLTFGAYVVSNGNFYFDDFELFFKEEGGEYQKVDVSNPGFENKVDKDNIPGWQQDTDKEKNVLKVKGYTFKSTDKSHSGKSALLIEGREVQQDSSNYITVEEGFTPQIGTLISMLNNLSNRVERVVKDLDIRQTDHLLDEKANRIGALVMHLAAAEKIYQNMTFENRRFNDEEKEQWQAGLSLGEEAREKFQGKPISYYLDIYKEVRKKTIEELKKRNDEWLEKSWPGAPMNNHFAWFHVMEHQSSHLGQILMLKKRIPEEENEIAIPKEEVDK